MLVKGTAVLLLVCALGLVVLRYTCLLMSAAAAVLSLQLMVRRLNMQCL
jgi:hypothetical protein